jgi:hypothetical protein
MVMLRNFEHYVIFMKVRVVITVTTVKLLRDFGPCGMFMNVCVVITVAMAAF